MVWRCQSLSQEHSKAGKISGLFGKKLMTSLLVMTDIVERESIMSECHGWGDKYQPKPHFGSNISGRNAFERLSNGDKWRMLAYVARYLFTDAGPAPKLTALSESTVYYIFMTLYLDMEGTPELHEDELLAVYKEQCDKNYAKHTEEISLNDWYGMIMDELAQLVLWDEDFLCEPEMAALMPRMNHALRIEPDYYTDTTVLAAANSQFATPAAARAYIFRLAAELRIE